MFELRKETFLRIEKITNRQLICYVAQTNQLTPQIPAHIDDSDLTAFQDFIDTTPNDEVDILLVSNGGSAEASERIVRLSRDKYNNIRFIVPGNTFSAATLICMSGDSVLMTGRGSLGPIDPQLNGIPVRTILRGFETVQEKIKAGGVGELGAYMPLIKKYDLHTLEMCRSAECRIIQRVSNKMVGSVYAQNKC